ncbi:MAG: tRNA preQ1(34) S-adenosylmethionine ribosyltransferase-isomerase QueA [Myxococcales bacterium]|nr:tRNA preQ1(34) S-adenosylmethionine ribosyltransferase-isomerase QueA [Myxococcales bacterium]
MPPLADDNRLARYDFDLPAELIAQHPAARRSASRLLVIPRERPLEHRRFADLVELFRPGDVLVRNNTKVLPARLIGRRESGGRIELLLLAPAAGVADRWRAMARPGRAMVPGAEFRFGELPVRIAARHPDGTVDVDFLVPAGQLLELLAREGRMPLPPYIRREDSEDPRVLAEDRERYQTVYAKIPGAVAAPTAGLHFTPELFAQLAARGVTVADLTLHVGAGTFLPVRSATLDDHVMHAERYELPAAAAEAINRGRAAGGRIVAVGTTSARVLETLGESAGPLAAAQGETRLFIRPGRPWRIVDVLVTNFHLPKSTLLVLVCALAGTERLLAAYREAVAQGYRFFSYGDACWIERA